MAYTAATTTNKEAMSCKAVCDESTLQGIGMHQRGGISKTCLRSDAIYGSPKSGQVIAKEL